MPDEGKRVELTGPAPEDGNRMQRVGLGLLLSLGLGYGPLSDAIRGHGSFTQAMVRFLLCLGFSLTVVMALGRLLDSAPAVEDDPDLG